MQSDDLRLQMREFYRSSITYQSQLTSHQEDTAAFYVKWLSGFVPTNQLILDLGCGTGFSTALLRELGYQVVGMDLSELFMNAPSDVETPCSFVSGDALELPFKQETFDAVSSAALIEHLPDVPQALNEMIRVLKPGGLLLILAPNHCSLTMPLGDVVNLLLANQGRPYFAETSGQALRWLAHNLRLNFYKLLSRKIDFRYVDPDLTIGTGGDHDMVYYASPIDLRRFLGRNGAPIVSWSGVKARTPLTNGQVSFRGSGIKRKLVQTLLWPFTSMTLIVARKRRWTRIGKP